MKAVPTVGYFSMEIGMSVTMPLYSGGLGVLAGDTLRSAADLHIPLVAITLLHRKGYFFQRLDAGGQQREEPVAWVPEDFLQEQRERVSVSIEGRTVWLRPWRYDVAGIDGGRVPVYLLDADLPENTEADRRLTDSLYGGNERYRLCQEIILGIGGVRVLRALGYGDLHTFHMNEGHASLLTVELLDEEAQRAGRATATRADVEAVRRQCVFTTHTPVPAGHDQFPMALANEVLRRPELFAMKDVFSRDGVLNMTYLALNLSYYVNGVATRHAEVSRAMFSPHVIDAITNGVHAATWASPPFSALFDAHIPGWRQDNAGLRHALRIPRTEVVKAHQRAKRSLIEFVNRATNAGMDVDVLTLGFGRRATPYKRTDLLLTDLERLHHVAETVGPLQVVYAGKAHPRDEGGKELIRRIVRAAASAAPRIKIVYLENYDIELARVLIAGSDVWLNTPQPPLEASGTSGMKAAINGVPSLSVLDGWWIEGHVEGVTGWSIGDPHEASAPAVDRSASDATSLYDKLERSIAPMFYREPDRLADVMLHAIALNGSFFNTQRMVQEYVSKAYLRQTPSSGMVAG